MSESNKSLIDYIREVWGASGEVLYYRDKSTFDEEEFCHTGNTQKK